MSVATDTITKVSLKSSPDYLPRVRRIVACLADSVGMDQQETHDAALLLTEAYVNAIQHGSPMGSCDNVQIVFKACSDSITMDITDFGGAHNIPDNIGEANSGFGVRLMKMLADSVEFIKHKAGLTVRLTKKAKLAPAVRPVNAKETIALHRN